jgi:hypothetical protein
MASVHEEVHQRASEYQKKWQVLQQSGKMRPMFGEADVCGYEYESNEHPFRARCRRFFACNFGHAAPPT